MVYSASFDFHHIVKPDSSPPSAPAPPLLLLSSHVDQQIEVMDHVLALKKPINDSSQQHRGYRDAETRLSPNPSDELHSHIGIRPYDRGTRRAGTAAGGVRVEGPGRDLSESGASMCVTGSEVEDAWCQPLRKRLMPHLRLDQRSVLARAGVSG